MLQHLRLRQSEVGSRDGAGAGVQVWKAVPAVYVPQLGDAVMYLREGHKRFLDDTNDKRRPPWQTVLPSQVRRRATMQRSPPADAHPTVSQETRLEWLISNRMGGSPHSRVCQC